MKETLSQKPVSDDPFALDQFAAPPLVQLQAVLLRVFQQYWRTPSYLYSKTALCTSVVRPLFICPCPIIIANTTAGSLCRLLLLGCTHLPSRSPKPTFCNFHVVDSVRQSLPANHAALCNAARTLRVPRTPIQDLLLGSLHHLQPHRRNALEHTRGYYPVLLMVLPYRSIQECSTYRRCRRAWRPDVLVPMEFRHVCWNIHTSRRSRY